MINGIIGEPNRIGSVDTGTPVVVEAYDQYDNLALGESGIVQLSVSGSATFDLSSSSTIELTFEQGSTLTQLSNEKVETVTLSLIAPGRPQVDASSSRFFTFVEGTYAMATLEESY